MTKITDLQEVPIDRSYVISEPRSWRWVPKDDITAREIALCLTPLLASFQSWTHSVDMAKLIEALPPEAVRHFEEIVK